VRLTVDVAGEVFCWPAELEEDLFQMAALRRMNYHGIRVELGSDQPFDLRAAQHLGQHRDVAADQNQSSGGVLLDPQPAVAVHRVGDLDQEGARHRIAAEAEQRIDHLLRVMAGGSRIPQAEGA
jgi:hypothetical protein